LVSVVQGERRLLSITTEMLKNSKVHLCLDRYESFSGAFLTTKDRLLSTYVGFDLAQKTLSCESAVMMMTRSRYKQLQSLDILDFSVINLSTYERLQIINKNHISEEELKQETYPVMSKIATNLKRNLNRPNITNLIKNQTRNMTAFDVGTVIIMPVLLSAKGTGNSRAINRKAYLAVCFWSFYATYSNIVAFVMNEEDLNYLV
jgi:hypothetical protein